MSDGVRKGQPNKVAVGCLGCFGLMIVIFFVIIAVIVLSVAHARKHESSSTQVVKTKIIEMTIRGSGKEHAIDFPANGRPFRATAPSLTGRIYWEALDHSGKVVFGPILVAVGVEQPEETFQDQPSWITTRYWIIDGASSQTLQFQYLD